MFQLRSVLVRCRSIFARSTAGRPSYLLVFGQIRSVQPRGISNAKQFSAVTVHSTNEPDHSESSIPILKASEAGTIRQGTPRASIGGGLVRPVELRRRLHADRAWGGSAGRFARLQPPAPSGRGRARHETRVAPSAELRRAPSWFGRSRADCFCAAGERHRSGSRHPIRHG